MMSSLPTATMSILFQWFPLIPDEFWHATSCIRKAISLSFCAYVKCPKWSSDVIWMSILIWMLPHHSSNGRDDIIMPIATVRTLFWLFLLTMDEYWYETSCNGKTISLSFCAYVNHQKRSSDASWTSILVWMCHTPFRDSGNEASIRMPRMFHSHV
jgi:hypothetical protein